MIVDYLQNINQYALPFDINKILEFINYAEQSGLQEGRYDIWGGDLFMMVQNYDTRSFTESRMESHKQYLDLQYIRSGEEQCRWENIRDLSGVVKEEGDNLFYHCVPEGSSVLLRTGMFAVFFPEDSHMPGLIVKEPSPVQKFVFKIRRNKEQQ